MTALISCVVYTISERIPWIENVSNGEVLETMESKWIFIFSTRQRELELLDRIMMKEGLRNLILTVEIEGKTVRRTQRKTNLMNG